MNHLTRKKREAPPLLDVIHLLPDKSLSLTSSLSNTSARCSIQTTRYSLWKKQQVSHWCSILQNSSSAVFEDGSSAAPVSLDYQLVRRRGCTWLCRLGWAGFQVLAELLPEDDGGRFPLCLWLLWFRRWSSASRVWRSENITLKNNTCLYPYHTQCQCSSDWDFSPQC